MRAADTGERAYVPWLFHFSPGSVGEISQQSYRGVEEPKGWAKEGSWIPDHYLFENWHASETRFFNGKALWFKAKNWDGCDKNKMLLFYLILILRFKKYHVTASLLFSFSYKTMHVDNRSSRGCTHSYRFLSFSCYLCTCYEDASLGL